jgi:hypothetical protein
MAAAFSSGCAEKRIVLCVKIAPHTNPKSYSLLAMPPVTDHQSMEKLTSIPPSCAIGAVPKIHVTELSKELCYRVPPTSDKVLNQRLFVGLRNVAGASK